MDQKVLEMNKDLFLKMWTSDPMGVNCYLLFSRKDNSAILIDPGGDEEKIDRFLNQEGLSLGLIIATHGHLDHILAIPGLRRRLKVPVACHPGDLQFFIEPDPFLSAFLGQGYVPFHPERVLQDGEQICIGSNQLMVIHTPGHSPGSIALLTGKFLFSGDTIFEAGFGRTDFPGGDYNTLMMSIRDRIFSLPDDTILFPGHGKASTVGKEKKRGYFP